MSQRKVFLSFIQKQPDEAIAHFLAKSLAEKNFEVHVVTNELRFGNKNQEKYTSLICGTDVFITLLSERAMVSEMMTVEIQLARQQFDKRKISIVPILINLPDNEIINEVVEQALSGIDLLQWNSQTSNDELLFLLLNRLSGGSKPKTEEQTESNAETKSVRQNTAGIPLPNAPLVPPGGNIAYNSLYYISRSGEDKFVDNILREGALLRIKGPRQFGKTSLLSRTIHFAKQHNHNIVALSFQHFGNDSMNDLDSLLMYLASYTTRKLKLQNRIKDFWEDEFLEGKMKCTAYFEEYILEQIQSLWYLQLTKPTAFLEIQFSLPIFLECLELGTKSEILIRFGINSNSLFRTLLRRIWLSVN